jgi:GntR family transcriptional regulator, arabinose operon transcriptional repressor
MTEKQTSSVSPALATKPEQVRRLILEYIARKGLKVDDRIPSRPEWRRDLGVSNDTLDRALRHLIQEGILVARAGSGTFLNQPVGKPSTEAKAAGRIVLDVLVPNEIEHFQSSASAHVVFRRLDGISRACRRSGMATSLHFLNPYKYLNLEELLENIGTLHHGAIFFQDELLARMEEHLIERRVPFAVLGLTQRKKNAVVVSVAEAYHALMRHLLSIDRRRIAYIGSEPSSPSSHLPAVQQAAAARGLGLSRVYWVDKDVRPVLERLVSRDLKEHGIDAVLCRNDHWALAAMDLFGRSGFAVPRDVVVIGCDDIATAGAAEPPLATIAQPFEESGEAAVACISKMIVDGVLTFDNVVVESRFIERASAQPQAVPADLARRPAENGR